MLIGMFEQQEFSFHHNVFISAETTSQEYYNQIKNEIKTFYDNQYGYGISFIPNFKVRV